MSKIQCKLFGVPQITRDHQAIFLPYAKTGALLYYMLVVKVVSRDEIAGLLWPDENDKIAKKNLRNAIYQAKKSLGEDIILSPKKSVLILNAELDVETDIDQFLRAPRENIHLYAGDFLQGFFLKEAEAYESWLAQMRLYYREKFSAECYGKIEADIQNKNYSEVERHIQRLTELDEYDERNFRLLMQFYQDTGRNSKVIETYYDLSKLLRRELGIDPDQKTKELYERSLERIDLGSMEYSHDDTFFYGRYEEIAAAEKILRNFREKRECTCLLVTGETGMGKTTVLRRLLSEVSGDFFILETCCHPAQQDIPLHPWRRLVREISRLGQQSGVIPSPLWWELMVKVFPDFSETPPTADFLASGEKVPFSAIAHIMTEAVLALAQQKQVLLVVEDLQWMDGESLRLLTAVLLDSGFASVMLVGTHNRDYSPDLNSALAALGRCHRPVHLALEPFDFESCHRFVTQALPNRELTGDLLDRLYTETEGNPFFLGEYIQQMQRGAGLDTLSPAMLDTIKSRFAYLSEEDMELAAILSLSYDELPLSALLHLTKIAPEEVFDHLQNLKRRNLIVERETEGDTLLSPTHIKLRQYLHQTLPPSRKKQLHQKIGLQLEEILDSGRRDSKLYAKLVYHFSACGDYLRALKYKMATVDYILNFTCEMFPVLGDMGVEQESKLYLSREKIDELFDNLDTSFKDIQYSARDSAELDLLRVKFFYMKGRYSIRDGRYESGVDSIMYVIEKSKQIGNWVYTLEGYKQILIYHIQTNTPKPMLQYIESALDLAVRCNDHREIGILLRLKGLYNMMIGNYNLAEQFLTESINTLAVTDEMARRYAVNIAGAYNYIGEIRQAEEDYPGALQLFDKAISLTLGKNALSSLALFYVNAGKTAFFTEDIPTARKYFENAYALYSQYDTFWRRSVLDCYMALTLIKEGRYAEALGSLMTARKYVEHLKNPSDLGTVYFVESLIRRMADGDEALKGAVTLHLNKPSHYYYRRALENLNQYRDRYEIKILKKTFENG